MTRNAYATKKQIEFAATLTARAATWIESWKEQMPDSDSRKPALIARIDAAMAKLATLSIDRQIEILRSGADLYPTTPAEMVRAAALIVMYAEAEGRTPPC